MKKYLIFFLLFIINNSLAQQPKIYLSTSRAEDYKNYIQADFSAFYNAIDNKYNLYEANTELNTFYDNKVNLNKIHLYYKLDTCEYKLNITFNDSIRFNLDKSLEIKIWTNLYNNSFDSTELFSLLRDKKIKSISLYKKHCFELHESYFFVDSSRENPFRKHYQINLDSSNIFFYKKYLNNKFDYFMDNIDSKFTLVRCNVGTSENYMGNKIYLNTMSYISLFYKNDTCEYKLIVYFDASKYIKTNHRSWTLENLPVSFFESEIYKQAKNMNIHNVIFVRKNCTPDGTTKILYLTDD